MEFHHFHLSNDEVELQNMVTRLESIVAQQQSDIKEKRSDLLKKKGQEKILANNDDPLLTILRRKERRLKQEVKLADDFPLEVEDQKLILDVTLENEIMMAIKMSESSITSLKKKKSNLDLQIKRVNDGIKSQKRVCSALENNMDELNKKQEQMNQPDYDDEDGTSQRVEEADLQKKLARKTKLFNSYADNLDSYLKNNFPALPAERVRGTGRSAPEKTINYKSMADIIQILVAKHMSTPHDSYVAVDETWWPPYLEGLLRHDIAVKHPQNRNKMSKVACEQTHEWDYGDQIRTVKEGLNLLGGHRQENFDHHIKSILFVNSISFKNNNIV